MTVRDVALVVAPFVGGFVVLRILDARAAPATATHRGPTPPPLGPSVAGEPIQVRPGPVTALPGRTYFAVLATNGSVALAANPARVKAEAEKQGFRDVAVFIQRPASFPGRATGDYYVRATYAGPRRDLERTTSVFLGSVVVLDAWISM